MVTVDKEALRTQLSLLNNGNKTTLPFVLLSLYTFLTKRGIDIEDWCPYMYYALAEFVNASEFPEKDKTLFRLDLVSNVTEDSVPVVNRLDSFDDLIVTKYDAIKAGYTDIVAFLDEEDLFPTLSGETGLIFRTVVVEKVARLCLEVKSGFIDCLPAVGLAVALPDGWEEAYRKHATSFLSSHPPNGEGPTLDEIIEAKKHTMKKFGLLPPPPAEVKLEEAPIVVKQEPAVATEIRKQNFEEATKRMNAAADAFHNENVNKGPVAAFWLAVRDFFNAKPAPVVAPAAQSRVQFEARPAAPLPAYKQVFLDRPAAPLPREAFVQLEEAPSRVDFDGKPAVSLEAAPAVAQSSAYDIARRRAEAHWAKHPRARKPDMAKLSRRIATDPHSYNPAKEDWPGIDTP